MTISRCELIDTERLKFQYVSSNDPDLIGVEVTLDGNVLLDVSMDAVGQTSALFDADGGRMEFDLNDLRRLLSKIETDLMDWRDRLTRPGEIWDHPK